MSFFEKVSERFKQGSQGAAQKVKELSDTIKLNNQIAEEKKALAGTFRRLGESYYELFGEKPDEMLEEYIAAIKESEEKIAALQAEKNLIKSLVKCPECGKLVDKDAAFCPECGYKMPELKEAPEEEDDAQRTCLACGEMIDKGTLFCPVCGAYIEEDEEVTE
jgi:RNA polymerase subunit RPABC4/transcription elongation factor Spt4